MDTTEPQRGTTQTSRPDSARTTAGCYRTPNTAERLLTLECWNLLSDPEARYIDVGARFHTSRTDPDRRRNHVRRLEALGYTVMLERTA